MTCIGISENVQDKVIKKYIQSSNDYKIEH